jgi:hypothetical protein
MRQRRNDLMFRRLPSLAGASSSWLAAAAASLLLGVSAAAAAPAARLCTPEVIGTWKLEAAGEPQTTLLRFSRDGWANVLSGAATQSPQELEILAQVTYALVPPRDPKRLQFTTKRGNDVFASGKSHWDIVSYSDQSLTTQPSDAPTGKTQYWERVQSQRYFLTLAGRDASATRPGAAFVLWTTLGEKMELEALGLMGGAGGSARLGRIPQELARDFVKASGRAEDIMLRIELSEAEYHRTHRVLEAWDAVLKQNLLARNDPQLQFAELLDATLQSANRCAPRLQLPRANANASGETAATGSQRVRTLRKLNDKRHIGDKVFPFGWRPPAVG